MSVAAPTRTISVIPIAGLPEFTKGMQVGAEIFHALRRTGTGLADGDVVLIAQKIVSKSEGRTVPLRSVSPSDAARELAARLGKNAEKVELILGESRRVILAEWPEGRPEGVLLCEHRSGFICANAGVDESNSGADGVAVLLPLDADASADRIRRELESDFGVTIGVIITDTFGRPWRIGLVNVAIGVSGIPAVIDLRGERDAEGRTLTGTMLAVADELAAAAGLTMGKLERTPVAIIRGWTFAGEDRAGTARDLIRPEEEDLFR